MARAGFNTSVYMSGTATAFTGTATTDLGSNRFQVTDTTKQVLSPDHAVSVLDGVSTLAADAYSVDYLFGIVTLDAPPVGTVTITGRYLPMLAVAQATGVEVNVTRVELGTDYLGTSYASLILGRKSGTVTLESTRLSSESVDTAGDITGDWEAIHDNATPKLVEVDFGGRKFRAWGVLPGLPQSAPQDGLVTGAREFKTVTRAASGRSEIISYGFGT